MKYIKTALQFLFTIYGFALFLACMFLVFPFAVIASLFGKIRGGNMIYYLCSIWTDIFMAFCGIFHSNRYEVPHDTKKQYVFVFNHISYMDIPVLVKSLRKQHIRVLGKAELSKVPVFGFLYRNAAVLVDRSSKEHRAKSVRELKAVIRKNISIVIAPEGTFNMTSQPLKDFFDGAFRIAIETQTPVKPMLILDAHDRLNHNNIFSLTPGRSRSVFLEEISVDGLTLDDLPMLKEKVFSTMAAKLIQYQASWIK